MDSEDRALTEEEWTAVIEQLCASKAEEFKLVGYEYVSGEEVWQCVSEKYGKTGTPLRHQIVNDILSLKVMRFMNFMTLSAYKGTHF